MAGSYYVYAILARETVLPSLTGFAGGALSTVHWRELAAAVSCLGTAEVRPTPEHVLRHEGIVEALRFAGPALPVRFGTVLADAGAVERAMAERYDVLTADLSRLGDKVELGLTVLWDTARMACGEPPTPGEDPLALVTSVGPGTRYLKARFAEHRREESLRSRARALARDLDRTLLCHALESRAVAVPTSGIALRATYLLESSKLVVFREALDGLRGGCPTLRFLLSGPWPPYSFVTPPGSPQRAATGDGDSRPATAASQSTSVNANT